MEISSHKVVIIDYTVTDEQGEVIDTSKDEEPLAYIHGTSNLIPGLEKALEGKSAGDSLNVDVPPEEAYGLRDETSLQVVSREQFEGVDDLQVGMQFEAQDDDDVQLVTIAAIDGDDVTLDANHPLAGITLHFEVSIVDVRDATQEELDHGHAHDPEGHQH